MRDIPVVSFIGYGLTQVSQQKKDGTKIILLKNGTRHSLGCRLLESGESTAMVARILGNAPSVIERAYGSISVRASGEALRKISNGGVVH